MVILAKSTNMACTRSSDNKPRQSINTNVNEPQSLPPSLPHSSMDLNNMLNPSSNTRAASRARRAHPNRVTKPSSARKTPVRQPPRPKPAESLQAASLHLLKTKAYSDLKLKCEDKEFFLHKSIVCPQSDFFAACMDSGMKESEDGTIELKEEIKEDVERMVRFLYTGGYDEHGLPDEIKEERLSDKEDSDSDGENTPQSNRYLPLTLLSERIYLTYKEGEEVTERGDEVVENDPLCINVRMYGMGRQYGIPGLCKVALEKVKTYVKIVNLGSGRTSAMIGQFQRVLDAVELALAVCNQDKTEDVEFTDILGRLVAREATDLVTEAPKKWRLLQKRCKGNKELGDYMFFWTAVENNNRLKEIQREKRRGRGLMHRMIEKLDRHFNQWMDECESMENCMELKVCGEHGGEDDCEGDLVPQLSTQNWTSTAGGDVLPNVEFYLDCNQCGREAEWDDVYPNPNQHPYYR